MLALVLVAAVDAATVMREVAARADAAALIRQQRHLAYTKNLSTENDKGDVKETKTWSGWWDDQGNHQRLIQRNGHAVNMLEPAQDVDLTALMRSRFIFSMADPPLVYGSEVCRGRDCYIIEFEPKADADIAPEERLEREQEILVSHLVGTVYVDAHDFFIVCVQGRQSSGFKHSVANFNEVSVVYRQHLFQGVPVITNSIVRVSYSVLLWNKFERRVYEYSDYQFVLP